MIAIGVRRRLEIGIEPRLYDDRTLEKQGGVTIVKRSTIVKQGLVFVQEHGAKLGQLLGRILERREHKRALIECEREQLDLGFERTLKPVGQVVGAGVTDEVGELLDGVVGDGEAGEHHRASLRA
jgi:hypothetical protein